MKMLSTILAALLMLPLAAFTVKAQTYVSVPLPNATLTGAASWGTTATTNLASGWTSVVSTTNISTLWSTSAGAFASTTNVVSVTNTLYADFDSTGQPWVVLQHQFNQTSGDTSNSVLVVAKSITGSFFDTINSVSITNTATSAGTAAAPTVGLYQIDMRGFARGRILSWTYQSTGTSDVITNGALYATGPQVKQGAPYAR